MLFSIILIILYIWIPSMSARMANKIEITVNLQKWLTIFFNLMIFMNNDEHIIMAKLIFNTFQVSSYEGRWLILG